MKEWGHGNVDDKRKRSYGEPEDGSSRDKEDVVGRVFTEGPSEGLQGSDRFHSEKIRR